MRLLTTLVTKEITSMIYLYVKQHTITGLKYFGKTKKSDPFKYLGSGMRWKYHINKHGKEHIQTLEVYGFDDQELCTEFALKFSKDNNIVESHEWANLCEENGLDGGNTGVVSKETRAKMSQSKLNCSLETRQKMSNSQRGRTHSKQTKLKISQSNLGKRHNIETRLKLSLAGKSKIGYKNPFYNKNHTNESKAKMSEKATGRKHSNETKEKLSKLGKGLKRTDETKRRISIAQTGRSPNIVICPHCSKSGDKRNMTRYHFNNCSFNK